ncbi:protein eyes shut [Achroia grisella]|uniref:protein eyes shut n=1 Tax=Achroia grisella TaxID=688607 RepID=UPI0027D22F23|nr:protein eyes shut [Achroia grisella]XP_059059427.1 protein eyes shut [Achroia grisella]
MFSDKSGAVRAAWCILLAVKIVTAGISCLSNPCFNGICIDDINSTYSCYCVDGYTGVQCQTNWDECWSSPCQNGGTCVDGIASYNCSCPDGFIGDNCETNYNECESNPCLNNGTCIDMTNGYMCSCVPGFSGHHCEVDIAVCNTTEEVRCYNGAKCIEGPGFKFYCECLPGWAGKYCEDQVDECQSDPCQNGGICIDVHADYMCACTFGYTGKSCEVQIEFCDENSCSNNALCVVEEGMRVCYCVPDYHGERCELQYDECLLGPRCMNGGTCIDGVDNFTCSCPSRLTGTLCECLILDDGSHDCEYVSPTPLTASTQSVLLTTMHEEVTTDITTSYSISYNDTIARTKTTDTELWTTATSEMATSTTTAEITAIESITTVTESSKANRSDETTETPRTTAFEPVTLKEVTDTSETSSITLESDDSKTESTTQCQEGCEQTLTSIKDITTTEMTKADTVMTKVIETTELTVSITDTTAPITESTIKETTPEITTTLKSDTTTEKMFTDSPTEQPSTEILTSHIPLTTESTELTTNSDNTTYVYTTVQSECTDNVCNNNGHCIASPHGVRCHCNFKYAGRFCDEKITISSAAFGGNSYITHKLRNSTSIDIEFNAKTLITDGQIMHVDIAEGVYMQLYMVSGLLKFKFSCGYQTMLLSELKTFVNKGYPMKIETTLDLYIKEQHCNATLRLNDTVAMSGGQVANISSIDHNATLHLGNTPDNKDSDNKPFIGCIKDLMVNGENREVFGDAMVAGEVSECASLSCLSAPCHNGGSCSDFGNTYTCSCPNGWMGEQCRQSVCDNNPCEAGGSCVRHPGSGFLCLCPYGKHGIFCEYNVEITRPSLAPISTGISSYLLYPLSPGAVHSDRFDLRLRFHTADMDQISLLAFVGQAGRHDSRTQHLAVTFVKGYIMLTWNMGSGPRRVFSARALSARRGGHALRVWRRGRNAGFSVDGRHNASGNAPARDTHMTLLPYLYIGGHPSEGFGELPHDLPLHSGWRGCVWDVSGAVSGPGSAAGRALAGRGAGQCGVAQCTAKSCSAPNGVCIQSPATYGCICNEGWFGPTCSSKTNPCDHFVSKCQGRCVINTKNEAQCDCPYGKTGTDCDQDLIPTDVLFTGTRSYIRLHPRTISSVSLSLEAEIKPSKERGLVLFGLTPHFYTTLSMQGGLLEYRWTDRLSGMTSLVRSGVVLSMSQWHNIKAGRYGSRLYVWVDGALSTEAMLAHAFPHTASNASIHLGGTNDLSTLPFDAMSGPPESFTGCIRNLHINNILLPLEPQNIQEGRNVLDCDGTACGGETCGGGACSVQAGRAHCACPPNDATATAGSTSARCRRHTTCSPANCAPPTGICRRGTCVCATGFAGFNCETRINITIPQFSGESFMSLGRGSASRYSGKQRVVLQRPDYLTLNFTTAELNGLLVWLVMDHNFMGIGLENAFLKLVWSFHHNITQDLQEDLSKTSRIVSRSVPQAGFLSDGEWHTLVVKLEKNNIVLIVDQALAYVEEPGLNRDVSYGDVNVYIGGITEENSKLAKKWFPKNFKGCIDNISTSPEIYVTNYTDVYSENVKSCQLFPI